MRKFDPSLLFIILYVFFHLCGDKYLILTNYSLKMIVVKILVKFLEAEIFSFPLFLNFSPINFSHG